ncbi:MAG: hypothetical protein ABI647_27160 [Gemmatimonadota bacterium]
MCRPSGDRCHPERIEESTLHHLRLHSEAIRTGYYSSAGGTGLLR